MAYKINEDEGLFIRKWFPVFGVRFCREKLNKTTSQVEAYVLKNKIKATFHYHCNIEDYFNIFTPEIVYTLGFLWADGCVSKSSKNSYCISFRVVKADAEYFERLLNKWDRFKWRRYKIPAKTHICKGKEIKGKEAVEFQLSDKYISNFLVRHDYTIKSGASADKIIGFIPEELRHYWFRGYFDGDGSFSHGLSNTIQLSSVHSQDWGFLIKLSDRLKINFNIKLTESNIGRASLFSIRRKNDCIAFLEYIYKDREVDNIGYDRKYLKYKNAKLQRIRKTSTFQGVCLDKSKRVNPWVCYYRGKYIACAESQEKALQLRNAHIKSLHETVID